MIFIRKIWVGKSHIHAYNSHSHKYVTIIPAAVAAAKSEDCTLYIISTDILYTTIRSVSRYSIILLVVPVYTTYPLIQ